MGKVIPFRLAPSFQCRAVTKGEAEQIQQILRETMNECPACKGRGVFLYANGARFGVERCPCGGNERDRIDPDDFGGAA